MPGSVPKASPRTSNPARSCWYEGLEHGRVTPPLLRTKRGRRSIVIARIWRGATREADAEAYVEYLRGTGLKAYRETPGNQGAWVLWRVADGRAEFLTLSFWESTEAIIGFAGADIERAVFY